MLSFCYFIKIRHAVLLRLMKKGSILYNRFWFFVSSLRQFMDFFFFLNQHKKKTCKEKSILSYEDMLSYC